MLNSEKENTSPVPPIGQEQDFLADAKRRLTLEVPNKISRRKSVENLVISSHDAIGQSISHALSFSGAITQQASQHSSSEHRSVSRSPSPCRRPIATPILEHGDYLGQSLEVGGNSNSTRSASDVLPSSQGSSPPPSLSLSTPLPEQSSLPPLNRSSSQEVHPRNPSASLNTSLPNSAASQNKSQETRTKKKSWYSALYPTYKSRSEDFKKIFKDVPDDERLIVDYSCAIQKDILVHGRLYVSQNYLCFYANIFRWETFLSLRWKDVTAITKEKTAIVIPNAILICTDSEKHFLTSFAGRDKTYMMLFRIWQNALMDQPMSSQEMWQWVHLCYGEELGFNSDDEEYPQNYLDEDKLTSMRLSAESISEDFLEHAMEGAGIGGMSDDNLPLPLVSASGNFNGGDTLPTDMSDSSQSDVDKPISFGHDIHGLECTDPHEGRKLMSMDIHVHIDQLFTMLFTNSKFYVELLALRKTTDLVQNVWNHDPETGLKTRKVSFTVLLNQSVGPKSAQVTETQVMLSCTRPGCLYSIEITSCNAGIPYADSFVVMVHYCLQKVSENVTNIQVFGQIKYKKSVWTVIKTFIEKNCWAGLEDYFDCLTKAIIAEIEEDHVTSKRKSRRRRRGMGVQREGGADLETALNAVQHRPTIGLRHRSPGGGALGSVAHNRAGPSTRLLWAVLAALSLLVIVNAALYWKLWGIEGTRWLFETEDRYSANVIGPENSPTPELIAEWSQLLKEQSSFHMGELDRWRKALNDAISLLKQTETALGNLQSIIKPSLEKLHPPTSHPNAEL